jgi:TPR repeat protein
LEEARNGFGEMNSNIENLLGVYYYDHYEPERAVRNFQKAWRRGNVKACYNLGLCHELGVGTQPDPVKVSLISVSFTI